MQTSFVQLDMSNQRQSESSNRKTDRQKTESGNANVIRSVRYSNQRQSESSNTDHNRKSAFLTHFL